MANNTWCVHKLTLQVQFLWPAPYGKQHLMRSQTDPTSTVSLTSPLWQTTPDASTNWPYKYSFSDQPRMANNTWCVHKLTLQVQPPWPAPYDKQHLMRPQTNPTSTQYYKTSPVNITCVCGTQMCGIYDILSARGGFFLRYSQNKNLQTTIIQKYLNFKISLL